MSSSRKSWGNRNSLKVILLFSALVTISGVSFVGGILLGSNVYSGQELPQTPSPADACLPTLTKEPLHSSSSPLSSIPILPENASKITHLKQLGNGQVTAIEFSPSGKWLAIATVTGTYLHDTETGKVAYSIPLAFASTLAFSPDEKFLALKQENNINIWDLVDQKLYWQLSEDRFPVFSSDSKVLFAMTPDGKEVHFWELANKNSKHTFLFTEPATSLAISPDGRMLASAGYGRHVYVWNAETGKLLRDFRNIEGGFSRDAHSHLAKLISEPFSGQDRTYVTSMAFSPDNRTLMIGSADGLLTQLNIQDDDSTYEYRNLNNESIPRLRMYISRLSFASAGVLVVSSNFANQGAAQIWEGSKQWYLARSYAQDNAVIVADNSGNLIAFYDYDAVEIARYEHYETLLHTRITGYGETVYDAVLTPMGEILTSSSYGNIVSWSRMGDDLPRKIYPSKMRVEHLKHKEQRFHETKKTGTNRPTLAQSR